MARSLLQRWADVQDVQFLGDSPRAWALGMGAMLGDDYPGAGGGIDGGCHLLFWGRAAPGAVPVIDYAAPVGYAPLPAGGTIRNYAAYPFEASKAFGLAVVAVSPGGVMSNPAPVVLIETDGSGVPIALVPNPPIRLRVQQRAAGYLAVFWDEYRIHEPTPRASTNLYHDGGSGIVDYGTVVKNTRGLYALLGPFSSGQTITVGARNVSALGDEEKNTNTATAIADADGPADLGAAALAFGDEG